jgi:hypothetical protein
MCPFSAAVKFPWPRRVFKYPSRLDMKQRYTGTITLTLYKTPCSPEFPANKPAAMTGCYKFSLLGLSHAAGSILYVACALQMPFIECICCRDIYVLATISPSTSLCYSSLARKELRSARFRQVQPSKDPVADDVAQGCQGALEPLVFAPI